MVAALALLLQLALSFGHVHLPQAERATAAAPIAATSDFGGKLHHDDDYCATCAILALLTGAQTAAPPAIVLPVSHATVATPTVAATLRLIARHDSFQSRAPPVS